MFLHCPRQRPVDLSRVTVAHRALSVNQDAAHTRQSPAGIPAGKWPQGCAQQRSKNWTWIVISQSTKLKTTPGNRYTHWGRQAALPWPEQHKVHLLFSHKQLTHNSWWKVLTGPSLWQHCHILLFTYAHCNISVLVLLRMWGSGADSPQKHRGCRAAWQSSCGRGTHSCTTFHHHLHGIQVKVSTASVFSC